MSKCSHNSSQQVIGNISICHWNCGQFLISEMQESGCTETRAITPIAAAREIGKHIAALEGEVERLRPSLCLMCNGGYEYINKEVTVYEGVKCHQFKNCDLRVPCDKESYD